MSRETRPHFHVPPARAARTEVEGGKHRAIRVVLRRLFKPRHRNIGNPVEHIGKPGRKRNRGSEKCRCVRNLWKPDPDIRDHPKTLLVFAETTCN